MRGVRGRAKGSPTRALPRLCAWPTQRVRSQPRRRESALRPCSAGSSQLGLGWRTKLLLELFQENSDSLALELVSHGSRNEAGKATCTNALANGCSKFTRNAYRELGCRLTHDRFLPW